jgi:transcriptional regulator with XRE-family HTH domain
MMSQSELIVEVLKRELKSAGKTYKDVAKVLKISEAGVKKSLNAESMPLQRVEQIASILGFSLVDVIRLVDEKTEVVQVFLTAKQEEMLAADEKLFIAYYLLLNGLNHEDILEGYDFRLNELMRCYEILSDLHLIKVSDQFKIRMRSVRDPIWLDQGPLMTKYGSSLVDEFIHRGYRHEERVYYRFVRGRLTEEAFEVMTNKMKALEQEFSTLAQRAKGGHPIGYFHAIKPWHFSVLEKYRRKQKTPRSNE